MQKILNLGKLLIILFSTSIFAEVNTFLSTKSAVKGDVVSLTIEASGEDIKFPNIHTIANSKVVGNSSSSHMSVINGKSFKKESKQYSFRANSSGIVEPFTVTIDGKEYKTKELKLNVSQPSSSKSGDDFWLDVTLDKKDVYVGDAIIVTFSFNYRVNRGVSQLRLVPFKPDGFWVKELSTSQPVLKNGFKVITKKYIIFPQKAGLLDIGKQKIVIGIEDYKVGFFATVKNINIYSNSNQINVKSLPSGVTVQGDYTIKATVDKSEVAVNKPVNLNVIIEGFGNMDDISNMKLEVDNSLVYDDKPILETSMVNGTYGGKWSQKFSIVGEDDYTIPAMSFKYFDTKDKSIKVIKTDTFQIKVNGKSNVPMPVLEKSTVNGVNVKKTEKQDINIFEKYFYLLIGLVIGVVLSAITFYFQNKTVVNKELKVQIKKAKSDRELYKVLLPYANKFELDDIMKQLEENIYSKGQNKINKKLVLEYIGKNML